MATFAERLNARGGNSFADRLAGKGKKRKSLPELRKDERLISQEAQSFGAPDLQEQPGLFTKIIDILSRPNFAVAGLTEELLNGKSVTSALSRGINELLSGVGPLEGQKRAFGQVLEGQGVGTKTLADALPFLEGTWVGAFGSRGAAGIGLDIATDPLTYLTFGTLGATKVALSGGKRTLLLTDKGVKRMAALRATEFGDDLATLAKKTAPESFDQAAANRFARNLDAKVSDRFAQLLDAGEISATEAIETGGIKFAGARIPGTDKFFKEIGPAMTSALQTLPGGENVIASGKAFSEGVQGSVNALFNPDGVLATLPKALQPRMRRLKSDFVRANAAIKQRMQNVLNFGLKSSKGEEIIDAGLAARYRGLEKADPEIGRKFYEIREQAAVGREPFQRSALTADQGKVYDEFVKLHDTMQETLIEAGIFTRKELKELGMLDRYFHHTYKNDPSEFKAIADQLNSSKDFSREVKGDLGKAFVKDRSHRTFADAIEESEKKVASRRAARVRGEIDADADLLLDPNYNLLENFERYSQDYADLLSRRAYREQAIHEFGVDVGKWDQDSLYSRIGTPTVRQAKNSKSVSRAVINSGIDSIENLPDAIRVGEIEETLPALFPDRNYVKVNSPWTGNKQIMLPEAIKKDLDRVQETLLGGRDHKEFNKLLRGADRVNNLFKLGVYTLWPASAVRDAYSNVALSMLDVGLGALDPKLHKDAVAMLARRGGEMFVPSSGRNVSRKFLMQQAEDLGVVVDPRVFTEQTGAEAAKFGTGKVASKLLKYRGLIENEARLQLWLNNIRRGVDPAEAAGRVNQFLFDYNSLSQVEREVFRRFIPFYTFTRKNVVLQAKTLITKPGLAINQVKPFRKRNDEQEMMTKWEAGALGIRLNRDGKTVSMLQGVDLPLKNLDTIWAGGFGATGRRLLGMMTPVLKVPLEVTTGRDFFTGGNIRRSRGDTMGRIIEVTNTPQSIKNWLGYKKTVDDAGRPKYTFDGVRYALLVKSWAFSRVFSTSDRQFREYLGDENVSAALTDFFTGIRFKELDLNEQQRRKLQNRIRLYEESLVRRGPRGTFSRSFDTSRRSEF